MVFLSPLFLIGLLAAAIPIAIHLIRKEKPPKLMFSTIRFLKKTSKKLVLFQQIQQWLLLLLRAALIALLVFAFARPLFNQSISRLLDTAPQSVVILLDNSMSMAYGERFENAKEAAIDVLNELSAGDEAAVVLFSGGVDSLQELTTDLDSLRTRVRNLEQPGYGLTRFMSNIRLADQMLAASRFDNREIYLISDFQQSGLSDAEPGWKLAPGVRFNGIDVGEAQSTNLVLTEVRSPEQLLENTGAQPILARVRSTGTVYRSQAEVSLRVDGAVIDRQTADLSNASEAVVNLSASFDSAGSYVGQVTLTGDDFTVDNDFHFTVEVSPRIRVLVVNGEASPNWYDDEAHWFTLAVNAAEQSPFAATSVDTAALDAAALEQADVVVLMNVGDLSTTQAAALERYVTDGGALLIAPGDQVDPQRFNQMLARVSPASLEAPGAMLDDYLVIADYDRRHPILRPLTSDWSARFQNYWMLTPADGASVLMRFDNSQPALVERVVGEGRSVVFASSMDLEWNNLALQGIFLPLVHETLRYLVQPPLRQRAYDVGQPVDLGLDNEADVSVTGPNGAAARFDRGSGLLYPDRPGVYRVIVEGEPRAYAVNTLTEESNLARTTVGSIHDDIINPDTSAIPSRAVRTAQLMAELEQPQRVWWWILALVMVLLLLEGRVANRTYR